MTLFAELSKKGNGHHTSAFKIFIVGCTVPNSNALAFVMLRLITKRQNFATVKHYNIYTVANSLKYLITSHFADNMRLATFEIET